MHTKPEDTTNEFTEQPVRKILAPIDFSVPSQRALLHALNVAHETQADLMVLNVSDPIPCPPGCSAHEYLVDQKLHRDRIKNEIHQLIATLWPRAFSGKLSAMAVEGVPSSEIVQAAQREGTDLIVISTYGRTGFKRFFLGSTADKVIRFSPCSVLVVKRKLVVPQLPLELVAENSAGGSTI